MSDWFIAFQEAVQRQSIEGMVQALTSQKTTHAGTAPAKIKQQAIKFLRKNVSEERFPLLKSFWSSDDPTAKEVGVMVAVDYYPMHPNEVVEILFNSADNQNWEVREWAASACGALLETHFNSFFQVIKEWVRDPSENRRRAVVLAFMYAGKTRQVEWIAPFLDVLEPLLSDRSRYVRDNLGPFAIGSALIRYYPAQVLSRLEKWAELEDEQVRWNVAMVFSAAEGANHAQEAEGILDKLRKDERPYVQRAVQKAYKAIEKVTLGKEKEGK